LLDVATLYLDYSETRHHKGTFAAKRIALKRLFLSVPPGTAPETLTLQAVLASLTRTARETTNANANKDRKELSAFWEFGKKFHGFPRLNPFREVERFPERQEGHYVPPVQDFWRVYEAADLRDKALLLTLLHTAGRRSEVLHLIWADVDFSQRKIRLSTCKTRDGSRERVWLTMTKALHQALADHRMRRHGGKEYVFVSKTTGEPYGDRKHFVERLCERAGVRPFGYHGIRGLSATLLAQEIPPQEVQKILRHQNLATTVRYIRSLGITDDRLSEVYDKTDAAPRAGIIRAVE
jgi:integrase